MTEAARLLPADLVGPSPYTSPEVATLVRIARTDHTVANTMASSLPEDERAIVLLHVGDAALRTCGKRSELPALIDQARTAYDGARLIASRKITSRWAVIEAAALYGLAIAEMAESKLWRAALQLRRGATVLTGVDSSSLIVEDLQIHGLDARRVAAAINELRADVLATIENGHAVTDAVTTDD